MTLFTRSCTTAGLLLLVAATPAVPAAPASGTIAPIIEEVGPTVVSISVQGEIQDEGDFLLNDPFFRNFFGLPEQVSPQKRGFRSAGSGVIVDAMHGYVLTNNHVVKNASDITVALAGGASYSAKIVGRNPQTDLAVVRIEASGLKAMELGDSGTVRVGDLVAAIGNPFGLGQTVTMGIVSALGRAGLGTERYENFIQTDASINPGNSGGALIDMNGKLIGINSAIIGPSSGSVGIVFAIPVSMVEDILERLIKGGTIRRGYMGIGIQDLDRSLADALGTMTCH